MWKPLTEKPVWGDFPVIAVCADEARSAYLDIIKEAGDVEGIPPIIYYNLKPWGLICEWHGIVAWKSLEFQKVNKEAGCYVNTDPHTTWT